MKRTIFICLLMAAFSYHGFSQCSGLCIPNVLCPSIKPDGGICDSILPPAIAFNPYQEDASFYMPKVVTAQGFTVQLLRITITGILGLPPGMNWECNNSAAGCQYFPQQGDTIGCVRFCGTPVAQPGNYPITVLITALVDAGFPVGQVTQNETYEAMIVVLPDTSGNAGFLMSPSQGCGAVTTTFSTNYPSNGHPGYSYSWSFGNGLQSSQENPPAQTYSQPGSYPVTHSVTIDTSSQYTLTEITVLTATGWNDNGGTCEPTGPDLFWVLSQGGFSQTSNVVDNTFPPVSWAVNIPLNNVQYSLQIWDDDDFFCGADDDLGAMFFNGHTAGTFILSGTGAQGSSTVQITITHPVIQLSFDDTLVVHPLPDTPAVSLTPAVDSLCQGDSVALTSAPSDFYAWYRDTTQIANAFGQSITVTQTGNYSVRITDINGCTAVSNPVPINVFPAPPVPQISFNSNTGELVVTNGSGFKIQWWLNNAPLSGADNWLFQVNQAGYYQVQLYNDLGCEAISDSLFVQYQDTTGIAGLIGSINNFEIIPNPNSGAFSVRVEGTFPQGGSVTVFSHQGKQIETQIIQPGLSNSVLPMDLSGFPAGLYLIKISGAGNPVTKKVVIH